MCRVLIYVLDSPARPRAPGGNPPYLPGDVVAVVEDGFFLGADIERGHPNGYSPANKWWRIVEIPGVPAADFESLSKRGNGRKRDRFIDVAALTPSVTKAAVNAAVRVRS
jgi:hypothetical protein